MAPSTNQSDARKFSAPARLRAFGSFLTRLEKFSNVLSAACALGSILTTILGVFFPELGGFDQVFAFGVAAVLLLSAAGLYHWQYKRAAARAVQPGPQERRALPTSMLRGLLPFEKGDRLFGRDADVRNILTMLNATGFRFGVLWGQSGCGKTSLLRAGLIPTLANRRWHVISVNRPTEDPTAALVREITRGAGGKAPMAYGEHQGPDLDWLVGAHGRTVIIYDQFEEFFLLRRTRSDVTQFRKQLANWVSRSDLPVVFLVSIREDYFAHLQHLTPDIPDPTLPRSTYELSNFHPDEASKVLEASLAADQGSWSSELHDAVIAELTTDGVVRPPELQLVGTYLLRNRISQLQPFREVGGVVGVLGSNIRDEIDRSGAPVLASQVLRALCSPYGVTKSPEDRSLQALSSYVATETSGGSKQGQIEAVLERFTEARIVVRTDDNKFNLVHDYLAPITFAATEGFETKQEKADRVLRRYLAEYRIDTRTRIPPQMLGNVRRHARVNLRTHPQAKRLILYSRLAATKAHVAVAGLILLVASVLYGANLGTVYLDTKTPFLDTKLPLVPTASERILVRTGHPYLKAFPGFDEAVVETDFTIADIEWRYHAELRRNELYAIRGAGPEDISRWHHLISKRMAPQVEVRAAALLDEPARAIGLAIPTALSEDCDKDVLDVLLWAGESGERVVASESVRDVFEDEERPILERVCAAYVAGLVAVTSDDRTLSSLFERLVEFLEQDVIELNTPVFERIGRNKLYALLDRAIANVGRFAPNEETLVERFMGTIEKPLKNDRTAYMMSDILVSLARRRPSVLSVQHLEELVSNTEDERVFPNAIELGRIRPELLTSEFLARLVSGLSEPGGRMGQGSRFFAIAELMALADVDVPEDLTSRLLNNSKLLGIRTNLARLAVSPEGRSGVVPEATTKLYVTADEGWEAMAIAQNSHVYTRWLAAVEREELRRLDGKFELLLEAIRRAQESSIKRGFVTFTEGMLRLVARLDRRLSLKETVALWLAAYPRGGEEYALNYAVLARHGAENVVGSEELVGLVAVDGPASVNDLWLGTPGSRVGGRLLTVAAARAAYQTVVDGESVNLQNWIELVESGSWMRRILGVVAMFERGLDSPSERERISDKIDGLAKTGQAHVRIAATRAKQVLATAGIVHAVHSGRLAFGPGIERLEQFRGMGFPVRQVALIAEQLIRHPGLIPVPPAQ